MDLVTRDILKRTLSQFQMPGPSECVPLRKSAVKRDQMIKVEFRDRPAVLVRFHDPRYYRHADIEHQTSLRSFLHSRGIPVAELFRTADGALYLDVELQGEVWPVTVEEWVAGEPPAAVTPALITLMGRTLGRMHLAAPDSGVSFGHGTRMSLFTHEERYAANAASLRGVFDGAGLGDHARALLFEPWERARDDLRRIWPGLPGGPVHADFAEYNLLLNETEDIAAVIDFNRAGDDRFVNELVHACLLLPSSGQDEHDRDSFRRFVSSYQEVRALSPDERLAMPHLIAVIRPFRSREVSPLLKAAEKRGTDALRAGLRRLSHLADPSVLLG